MEFNVPLDMTLTELKHAYILHIMTYCKGNRSHAAKRLGISIRCMRNYINSMKAKGFEVPDNELYKERGQWRLNYKSEI